jgi:hypothetical protein
MPAKLLHEANGLRIFSIVLAQGEEAMQTLGEFVRTKNIAAAQLSAIGAFSKGMLGYFDWASKDYVKIPIDEQVEIASLLGDVALGEDGKPALHVHCVVSGRDGGARAGHLLSGMVRPTLEIILTESPAHLRKRHDPESGLALIDLTARP